MRASRAAAKQALEIAALKEEVVGLGEKVAELGKEIRKLGLVVRRLVKLFNASVVGSNVAGEGSGGAEGRKVENEKE